MKSYQQGDMSSVEDGDGVQTESQIGVSRRGFLKNAAVGAAMTAVVGGGFLGEQFASAEILPNRTSAGTPKWDKEVDVAVIGAGPAGAIASAYLAKAGLRTVVFDRVCAGGERFDTPIVRDGFRVEKHLHCIQRNIMDNGVGMWAKAAQETETAYTWEVLPQNAVRIDATGEERFLNYCTSGKALVKWFKGIGMNFPPATQKALAKVYDTALATPFDVLWSKEWDETPAIEWLNKITDDPTTHAVLRHFAASTVCVEDAIALETISTNSMVAMFLCGNFGGHHELTKAERSPCIALPLAFLDSAKEHGAEILAPYRVKRLVIEDGVAKGVVVSKPDGSQESYKAKYVIYTGRWSDYRNFFGEAIPKHLDEIVEGWSKSDAVSLDLHWGLDKKILQNLSCQLMLMDAKGNYEAVVASYSNIDPTWAPPGHQAVICELFVNVKRFKEKPLEQWWEQMRQSVLTRWPEVKEHIMWEEKFFIPTAGVTYGGFAARHFPHKSGIGGLFLAGDCTEGRGCYTERAADSGMKVAKMIIKSEA